MAARLIPSLIFICKSLVFAESLSDDLLFPDSNLPLESSIFSPWDPIASPSLLEEDTFTTDTSGLIAWTEGENENDASYFLGSSAFSDPIIADSSSSPLLTDCAASSAEFLPDWTKLRARRENGPGLCANLVRAGAAGANFPDLPGLRQLRRRPEGRVRIQQALANPDHNPLCFLYSLGLLPWGVCSSGAPEDVMLSNTQGLLVWMYGPFIQYTVSHCTPGM